MTYALFFFGLLLAGIGGEIFLKGIIGFSRWTRLAPAVVGTTVAAFATSSPELSVGVSASLAGAGGITLGDALGSNIVNVSLILGLVLVSARTTFTRSDLEQNLPVALLAPVLTLLLASDGEISRVDGLLLLLLFAGWVTGVLHAATPQPKPIGVELGKGSTCLYLIIGLALLGGAGYCIVEGASAMGRWFGLSEYVIGTTIVAIGTSIPELATSLISALRGYHEVSIHTILGSNLFNGLFIIGVAALIAPIALNVSQVLIGLSFGLLSLLFIFPGEGVRLGMQRGVMLLLLYSGYVALLLV